MGVSTYKVQILLSNYSPSLNGKPFLNVHWQWNILSKEDYGAPSLLVFPRQEKSFCFKQDFNLYGFWLLSFVGYFILNLRVFLTCCPASDFDVVFLI